MGGNDEPSNIVALTAKEHFIVHKILSLLHPDSESLRWAVWLMANMKSPDQERNYVIGSREYQRLRENLKFSDEHKAKISKACSGEGNGFYGKKHSEETLQKMRESRSNKTYEELYGIERANELKEHFRNRAKENFKHHGKTFEEAYGVERANEIKSKLKKRRTHKQCLIDKYGEEKGLQLFRESYKNRKYKKNA
jgi:hypothetical protein